ncbi:MAG: carboxypeptidase regulatory-like domain-containing protein [Gemmatimonadaceae bacterium]|nr:carboxypeptidase regulatory-like domain-containing protein [Gemmatimonadaceae bacterium]
MLRRLFLQVLTLFLFAAAAPPAFAQTVDVIRGRITGATNEPLEGVSILVTSISGNVNRPARTDRQGRFTVTFPNGDGDYMVTVTAVGYALKRFEVKRVADEDVLLADAKLTPVGTVLDPMRVTADRQRVSRNETQQDVGGTERIINNMAALPPDQLGDLAAMAATLPGVQLVPGQDGTNGYSVMGLGADQNNTTLNGMNFGGAGLPRDAGVSSSLITSPYDVARGGFSGGQFSLRTRSGTNFRNRNLSFLGDAPQLQWMDAAARATGQQYANGSLGGSVSGPLVFDKAFYNVAFQVGRRSNDLQTLLNMSPTGLQASGVARDSVQRLMSILGSNAVPLDAGGIPGSRLADQGSVVGAFDFAPPTSTSGVAYNLTFNGAWTKQNPAGALTTSLPNAGGERTGWNGGVQGRHSAYLTFGDISMLTETSVGFNASNNEGTPYLDLPGGRVRVNSTFADGTFGLQNLAFGGNQVMATSQASNSLMAMNTLSWFSADNKHRIKLTSEVRRDGSMQDQTVNRLGTYTYNSLADLQAGVPVAYTRTLSPRERDAGMLIGAMSLGDSYRYSPTLQIQYGLRVDANRFLDLPTFNSALEEKLDVRNDRVPNGVYFSPRVGFSWQYGTAPQIGAFEGAFRGPRAVVRGGIGVFQNMPQATLVGGAIDNTGLPSAIQQLACVGAAVPMPNWSAFSNPNNIPTRCADGSTGTVFNNAVPNVNLFSNAFMPTRSVRSNLSWSGPVLFNRLNGSFDATYSLNLNQASVIDRNFAGTQRFTLDAEGGRPVYVLPSSIVPLTGGIAAGDGRKVADYQRVTEQMSDLQSRSAQFSVRLSPIQFNSKFSWNASYTYGNVREEFRGFQSTVGNPFDVQSSRASFDSRHQITYSLNWNAFDLIRLSWFGQFRSGSPFTPGIGGDVNGDGFANDRAFIFNPQGTTDQALASQMSTLLAGGSDVARNCLTQQLGKLAGRNSCQGPWVSSANLSISFNPLKLRLPQRANLSFNVSNPLGAADLLINGEDNLKGWGQQIFADPTLLYVRGFDPVTRQYKYEVNQRFGATNPQFQQFRAPVTVSMMLRYDIGPTRERQMLTQALDRGRSTEGTKAPEALIKAQFGNGGVPNPLATILRDQDTLRLSADQADSLASMNRRFIIRLDSIWAPIAKQFAGLPDGYDRDRVYWQYVKAREASIDILRGYAPSVKHLLSVEQRRKLPPFITTALDDRYLKSIRSGTAGGGGNAFMGGGGPMFMGAGGAAMGSSQTIIMR